MNKIIFAVIGILIGAASFVDKTLGRIGPAQKVEFVCYEVRRQLDEAVLTASMTFRSQKQALLSISSVKMKVLSKLSTISQADIILVIPSITAAGGGETASTILVRGLSASGQ